MSTQLLIEILRDLAEKRRADGEVNHDWSRGYNTGYIKGIECALFFLNEERACADHKAIMDRIMAEHETEEIA